MAGTVIYHKPAKRWYIHIYWKGEHVRIWKDYDTFQPFFTRARAQKYLGIVQKQIDDQDFDPKYWKPDSPVSMAVYASAWLDEKKVDYRTWRGYKTDVNKYIIPYFQQTDIRTIKAKKIRQFMLWLEEEGLSQDTIYHKMSTLKTMFRDAYRDEDILRIPPFPVLSRKQLTRPDSLTLEQQECLISAIPERHRPIFQIGMEFGLRVGEARAIMKDCVTNTHIIIKRAFSDNRLKDTKTHLEREYELTEYARKTLDDIPKQLSPFVFVRDDGKHYTNKNLNKIWGEACKKTGIEIKLQNAFRHSLGCQLADMGYGVEHIAEQLGHTEIKTTKRYARSSEGILTQALEKRRAKVIKIHEVH